MWEFELKMSKLGLFQDASLAGDLRDSKSTSRGLLCVFGSHTFVPISWMCRSEPHLLTASQSLTLFRLTQVYVWMVYWLFNFGSASWKHCPVKLPRRTCCVTNAIESFRLVHILSTVYLSQIDHVPPNIQNNSQIQSNSTSSKTMRQWSKWSTKDDAHI